LPAECSSLDVDVADGADKDVTTAQLIRTGIEAMPVVIKSEDLPRVISSKMEDTERLGKDIQILDLQTRIIELEAALEAGNIDVQFAILNRAGINHRWHRRPTEVDTVIFFDLDYIHDHNERWGYDVTDNRIRAVMSQINHYWTFRWYSGDEFGLLCAASDAGGFADRVKLLLREQGMTATFGIAPIVDDDLEKSLSRAASLVQEAKAKGIRGAILEA
jgi:GGDEF domain-containing protein